MIARYTFFLLICFLCVQPELKSQDQWFTQFDYNPMMTNPAQTGDFYGTFRIGGGYRNQGFAVTSNSYATPYFFIDAPLFKGFRDKDWVGVGGFLMQDQAGAGQLSTGEIMFNASYHFSLSSNKKDFKYLVLGLQGGMYSRQFGRADDLMFEDGIISGMQSQDNGSASSNGDNRLSASIGLMYRQKDTDGNEWRIGGRVGRLFGHDYSIASNTPNIDIPLRFTVHGAYDIPLNPKFTLRPQVIAQLIGDFSEYTLQARGKYLINPDKEIYLLPGVGYRLGDAAQLMLGMQFKTLQASLAYDLSTSSIRMANGTAGAIELGVMWLIRIYKDPKVEKRIFCPRF